MLAQPESPERGALPQMPAALRRRRMLRLVHSFTSPLAPDDYLELLNPLWSTRELRGRVQSVTRETDDAVTILIKPGWEWPGHRAGQYIRLGVNVDGVHHWRAYSLTSEPQRADGCIAITPKLVPGGHVSPFLSERLRPGEIVRIGGVEGTFVLPDPLPARLLFISAGSGVTPIASMLRALRARGAFGPTGGCDAAHVHSARERAGVVFGRELAELDAASSRYRLHLRITGEHPRLQPHELDAICPDWRERETFLCGPPGLIDAMSAHWSENGDRARLHLERFTAEGALGEGERGCGGAISLRRSGVEAHSDGEEPILLAGERAGASLPFGCRMGICHSCVGRLCSGSVRDLRTGRVHGAPGELVRTCMNAPEGAIEIDL
jgi:stearoyl-CoA 9-desaturase NADPH oxidoreductase